MSISRRGFLSAVVGSVVAHPVSVLGTTLPVVTKPVGIGRGLLKPIFYVDGDLYESIDWTRIPSVPAKFPPSPHLDDRSDWDIERALDLIAQRKQAKERILNHG